MDNATYFASRARQDRESGERIPIYGSCPVLEEQSEHGGRPTAAFQGTSHSAYAAARRAQGQSNLAEYVSTTDRMVKERLKTIIPEQTATIGSETLPKPMKYNRSPSPPGLNTFYSHITEPMIQRARDQLFAQAPCGPVRPGDKGLHALAEAAVVVECFSTPLAAIPTPKHPVVDYAAEAAVMSRQQLSPTGSASSLDRKRKTTTSCRKVPRKRTKQYKPRNPDEHRWRNDLYQFGINLKAALKARLGPTDSSTDCFEAFHEAIVLKNTGDNAWQQGQYLNSRERTFCRQEFWDISEDVYLCQKRRLCLGLAAWVELNRDSTQNAFGVTTGQYVVSVDANKCRPIIEAWQQWGWLPPWTSKDKEIPAELDRLFPTVYCQKLLKEVYQYEQVHVEQGNRTLGVDNNGKYVLIPRVKPGTSQTDRGGLQQSS
jgi:hypothetical protein